MWELISALNFESTTALEQSTIQVTYAKLPNLINCCRSPETWKPLKQKILDTTTAMFFTLGYGIYHCSQNTLRRKYRNRQHRNTIVHLTTEPRSFQTHRRNTASPFKFCVFGTRYVFRLMKCFCLSFVFK